MIYSHIDLTELRKALEKSWDRHTSYLGVVESNNPALGQCYPTSRVIQAFLPDAEIVEGEVWAGTAAEKHFWNLLLVNGNIRHIDFTWQQFPAGSVVKKYKIRDRATLGDGPETIARVELLLDRVNRHLQIKSGDNCICNRHR